MAKSVSVFVCNSCGYESAKWLGKCPACNEWNTFFEERIAKKTTDTRKKEVQSKPINLSEINIEVSDRLQTGYKELDRVLGGGMIPGSLILLGGDPGIGKSTLVLQLCDKIKVNGIVLYISGEESATQLKLRAERLGITGKKIVFLGETSIEAIDSNIEEIKPDLVVIDSIQTMYDDNISSAPGSVSQLRECTSQIMRICKKQNISTIIIGHVTKEGSIAGPRVLEHMVDTVLYLEGERYLSYRILRSVKNRFGATNEIGVFEMQDSGMNEIENTFAFLMTDRDEKASGAVIVPAIEGTRTVLVEIQALTTPTIFGMPRRTANGVDYNRVNLLMAVIEKNAGILLNAYDAYVNIVGGIRITEPAVDLGVVLSIVSSFKNIPIEKDVVVIGEVGLTGEIRSVNLIENRIKEVEKMGFKRCIIPFANKDKLSKKYDIEIVGVKNVKEAINEVIR